VLFSTAGDVLAHEEWSKNMRWISRSLFAGLYLCCHAVFAEDAVHKTKSWNGVTVYGSLTEDKCIKYFLESQLRFVDDHVNKFETVYLEGGVGRQVLQNLVLWFGFRWDTFNDYTGGIGNDTVLWQQFSWDIYKTDYIKIVDRTRVEEIMYHSHNNVFVLFNQRVAIEIPIDQANKYYIAFYESIYLQINHPEWVTNKLLNQNRAFVGLKYRVGQHDSIYFGYINQYQFNEPDVNNNIVGLRLESNYD
jgi:hypothetical protein